MVLTNCDFNNHECVVWIIYTKTVFFFLKNKIYKMFIKVKHN